MGPHKMRKMAEKSLPTRLKPCKGGKNQMAKKPTGSEEQVRAAIQRQLRANEVLLEGTRFTDPRHGDVEVDFLILIPGSGIAVVEVKGGNITLREGQWVASYGNVQRRIDPIEQARRAKHALRRYLDRQSEWTTGLVRAEWFVVMPFTEVTSDMSTEARRELLIGKSDLNDLLPRIRAALDSTLNNDPRPDAESVELALSLLLRKRDLDELADDPRPAQWKRPIVWGSIAAAAALIAGGLVLTNGQDSEPQIEQRSVETSSECDPNYEPCIPVQGDLSCTDIKQLVTVIGVDIHQFDRDSDGVGCEIYQ